MSTSTQDVAEDLPVLQLKAKDFKSKIDPDWCAGCGDFGVLKTLQKVCAELGIRPHEIVTVSGIGCSSNFPGYFNAYGMHTLHGRSLPVASGLKLANHKLNVIVTGGDDSPAFATLLVCPPTNLVSFAASLHHRLVLVPRTDSPNRIIAC